MLDKEKIQKFNILEVQVKETLKHLNKDLHINTKQLTDNINLIFQTTYTESEIKDVLGYLFEKQFNEGDSKEYD